MKQSAVRRLNTLANKLLLLAFASGVLLLATLYLDRGGRVRSSVLAFPQMAVYGICALFHAFAFFRLRAFVCRQNGTLDLLYLFLLFWAFYATVLLPLSGLGCLEWLLVLLVLSADMLNRAFGLRLPVKAFTGHSPLALMLFGTALFIIKIEVFYFFPADIYAEYASGNLMFRTVLAVTVAMLLFFALSMLAVQLAGTLRRAAGLKKQPPVQRTALARAGHSCVSVLKALCTGGRLLLVLLIVLLAGGIVCVFAVQRVLADMLALVEPLLLRLFTTGEHAVPKTSLYGLTQTAALLLCLGYQLAVEEQLERAVQERVRQLAAELSRRRVQVQLRGSLAEKTRCLSDETELRRAVEALLALRKS